MWVVYTKHLVFYLAFFSINYETSETGATLLGLKKMYWQYPYLTQNTGWNLMGLTLSQFRCSFIESFTIFIVSDYNTWRDWPQHTTYNRPNNSFQEPWLWLMSHACYFVSLKVFYYFTFEKKKTDTIT